MNGVRSEPLVQVVTPVHDEEDYLAQCIESVIRQTYQNWTYTIVDNCSTDRSLEIAQRYAERDPRIRVERNETFLSQLGNLNKTMSLVSPESRYCKMVLGDDWLFPACLSEMVAVAEEHPSVGIVSAYRLDDKTVNCDGLPFPSPLVSGRDVCRASLVGGLYVFGTPTTVLYRGDVVRERVPFFDEGSLHADTEACYEILEDHDLGFVHQVLTFTRRENESLASARKTFDPHHLLDRLITTVKYGPVYLDRAEYDACLQTLEAGYYEFLAERALQPDRASFWAYHRDGMKAIDYELERGKYRRQRVLAVLRRLKRFLGLVTRLAR